MSLRRKLMMVLLLTAVLPMLAVRAVQAVSIYKLRQDVGTDIRERLTGEAQASMQRTVEGYADSLDAVNQLGFALLRIQANEVEQRLAGPRPQQPEPVPTAEQFADFDDPQRGQWGIENTQQHFFTGEDGESRPLAISYQTQVVVLPDTNKDTNKDAYKDTGTGADGPTPTQQAAIDRLSGMTRTYRQLQAEAPDVILWQYTALSSGLHFSYPGKAQFPDGFSPQQQDWYRLAIAEQAPTYLPPYVDSSTRQLVVTFCQPLQSPDGGVAGVTAMDLSVNRLLDPMDLNTDWADEARVMVVAARPARRVTDELADGPGDVRDAPAARSDRTGQPGLTAQGHQADTRYPHDVYIVADVHQALDADRRHTALATVAFDDPADRRSIADDLLAGRSGVRRASVDGQDLMIAYGRFAGEQGRPLFALIAAPASTILAPAESAIREVDRELEASLVTTGGILLGLLVLVGVVAFGLSHRLSRPIIEMADASRRVAQGDLDTRVQIERNDELGQLGKAFNEMVPALNDRMRIRESLAVAMQVQQSLLPADAPSVAGLDIAGHSEYCDETGGDYYDFIELDRFGPDTLAVAVGDVTGHGIAAALLMATGRALIRANADTPGSLGEVFSAVNRQLCQSAFTGRFMTLVYLIITPHCDDHGRITVRYLSAGHDPTLVYRPAEDRFIELAGNDIPLGIQDNWSFTEHRPDALRQGDILVAGTDGIWECFNAEGEQFGKERMKQVIRETSEGSAQSISQAITDACHAWRGERDQNDDITQVVVKLCA